ncbi:hypothetical protein ACFX2J_046405 [Malus domestica]
MIAFSKIEEASFSESREPDPRQDCLFENRRGTTFPTSRAGSPWIKVVCNLHTQHQKSKRRLLRNQRGVCFLKSWAAQRPRGSISEIEEAFAFSKAGLLKDHEGRSQKSKRLAFSKAGLLRDHEGRS